MEVLEKILERENLNEAYKRVYANKGASGVDGVTVGEITRLSQRTQSRAIGKHTDM